MHIPIKTDDVPVTRKMLDEAAESIKSELHMLDQTMEAGFTQMDRGFSNIEARFNSFEQTMDRGFSNIEARFNSFGDRLELKFDRLIAVLTKNTELMEKHFAETQPLFDKMRRVVEAERTKSALLAKKPPVLIGKT